MRSRKNIHREKRRLWEIVRDNKAIAIKSREVANVSLAISILTVVSVLAWIVFHTCV